MAPPPLPPGVDPMAVARYGAWFLGRRQHNAAKRRKWSVPTRRSQCLVGQFTQLFWPWAIHEYPGVQRGLAGLLGFKSQSYARNLMTGRRVPAKHLRRLVDYLEARLAQERMLLDRLREELARSEAAAAAWKIARYQRLARWRRKQRDLRPL